MEDQKKRSLIYLYSFAIAFSFQGWRVLANNFGVEGFGANAFDIGIVQSVREIPGLLVMFSVLLTIFFKEQRLFSTFLLLASFSVMVTGFFPSTVGFALTTFLMSIGFHYFESYRSSLGLQWVSKEDTPRFLGKRTRIEASGAILSFAVLSLFSFLLGDRFDILFLIAGVVGLLFALYGMLAFPVFEAHVEQAKKLFLKKEYTLYYILSFFSGARRQIFVVFSTFYMVSIFHAQVYHLAMLFIINQIIRLILAPFVSKLIYRFGERRLLIVEYFSLILIFLGYAFAKAHWQVSVLYVLDHIFFSLAIALTSFFKKIADPKDISATYAVSFSINHIMAVIIPVVAGLFWINFGPFWVFVGGSFGALGSLVVALLISKTPTYGKTTIFKTFQHF